MSGIKFDGEKPDYSLVPPFALDELAKLLTIGAKKYAPNNWQKVKPKKRYYAAAARHLSQYLMAVLKGDKKLQYDEETGIHHLICVACNVMFLYEHETIYSTDSSFYGEDEQKSTKPNIDKKIIDEITKSNYNPQYDTSCSPFYPPWTTTFVYTKSNKI